MMDAMLARIIALVDWLESYESGWGCEVQAFTDRDGGELFLGVNCPPPQKDDEPFLYKRQESEILEQLEMRALVVPGVRVVCI